MAAVNTLRAILVAGAVLAAVVAAANRQWAAAAVLVVGVAVHGLLSVYQHRTSARDGRHPA
ncbi:hypothetical protein BH23ACT7_BH23ACT7_09830 [soil metagenome]|jgi:hypothetical protein|nr:hypothetical protein [Euzebyaceae bacterium]